MCTAGQRLRGACVHAHTGSGWRPGCTPARWPAEVLSTCAPCWAHAAPECNWLRALPWPAECQGSFTLALSPYERSGPVQLQKHPAALASCVSHMRGVARSLIATHALLPPACELLALSSPADWLANLSTNVPHATPKGSTLGYQHEQTERPFPSEQRARDAATPPPTLYDTRSIAKLTVFCLCAMVEVGLKATRMTMSSPFARPPWMPPLRLVRVRTCRPARAACAHVVQGG